MSQTFWLPVIIERDENGVFVAECPLLRGCYTQGETLGKVMENIREVIQMHIELMMERGEPLPSIAENSKGCKFDARLIYGLR